MGEKEKYQSDLDKSVKIRDLLGVLWLCFLFDAQWTGLFWLTLYILIGMFIDREAKNKFIDEQNKELDKKNYEKSNNVN